MHEWMCLSVPIYLAPRFFHAQFHRRICQRENGKKWREIISTFALVQESYLWPYTGIQLHELPVFTPSENWFIARSIAPRNRNTLSIEASIPPLWLSALKPIWIIALTTPRPINQPIINAKPFPKSQLENLQDVVMVAMGSLAESRDPETGNHIRRTQNYVKSCG